MKDWVEEIAPMPSDIPEEKKSPRGKCPRCGKRIALTKTGRLRMHQAKTVSVYHSQTCGGSRGLPTEGSVK